MERRKFYLGIARDAEEKLAVQSFLIHNGVNVFGEIVCMPDTAESVAREQGMVKAMEKGKRPHHRAS